MSGTRKLNSFSSAGRFVLLFFGISSLAIVGCLAPRAPVTNIVVDADVRDCAPEVIDAIGPLDVAIVIDTSQSTRRPTGFDIDGDGSIHRFHRNNAIDRGDSRLAAQIAAVRPLLRNAKGRDIRFSIVSFSGPNVERTDGRTQSRGSIRDSAIRAKLTDDMRGLDVVLSDLLEAGSEGKTIFFAGMHRATRSLIRTRDQTRRRVVLFMSDSAWPISLEVNGDLQHRDSRMRRAAIAARRHDVVIHTFGLSPESTQWRDRALGQIPGATGGTYHPIEDPRQLYCHLAYSLLPRYQREQRRWGRAFSRIQKSEAEISTNTTPGSRGIIPER